MPYYFEIESRPRRVVELHRRNAQPLLDIELTSVEQEMVSEEFSLHELRERVDGINNAIRRLTKGLDKPDGQMGGPPSDRARAEWERRVEVERRRLPENLRLIALTERKVAMLHRVLAGKQTDDTLPPPVRREVPAPRPSEVPVSVVHEDQDYSAPDEGQSPPPDRVAEVARRLDLLNIPADMGRPSVRRMLTMRAPDFKVGDADLAAAIKQRRALSNA